MQKNSVNLQRFLFEAIRNRIPPHLSLADEVAEILCISNDSAYRRIRGEKTLSLNEALKLALNYEISLDELSGIDSSVIPFRAYRLDENHFTFESYLRSLLSEMTELLIFPEHELIFLLNEINLFHVLQIPEMAAFKFFFWSKSSLDFKEMRERKFSFFEAQSKMPELCRKLTDLYVKFDTVELITDQFLNSYSKQILFYSDSGFFKRVEDALILCEKGVALIEHLRRQAEKGYKFVYGDNPEQPQGKFRLYHNDLSLIDNTIIACQGETGVTYLTNGAINLLATKNQSFYLKNQEMAHTILRKSTMISDQAERERNLFFNSVLGDLEKVRDKLARRNPYFSMGRTNESR